MVSPATEAAIAARSEQLGVVPEGQLSPALSSETSTMKVAARAAAGVSVAMKQARRNDAILEVVPIMGPPVGERVTGLEC
jgi:hypothetical protein